MKEFSNLQNECLQLIESHNKCENNCCNNHFCINNGCKESDCSNCMYNILHNPNPQIHYSCNRITYYYVLRFFNRFASEISHLIDLFVPHINKTITDIYIVSLGCGPGTEIYGFLKSLNDTHPNIKLHYEGHDLEKSGETVQNISKRCLSNMNHNINFYSTDMFADFHGFNNDYINFLILNYVLSDAVKYLTKEQKTNFIDNIVGFIIDNNVRNVIFNDIKYYGYPLLLDSGIQLMKLLISKLKKRGKNIKELYFEFDCNPYGNEHWIRHKTNILKFNNIENNSFMENINNCKSRQIYIHII